MIYNIYIYIISKKFWQKKKRSNLKLNFFYCPFFVLFSFIFFIPKYEDIFLSNFVCHEKNYNMASMISLLKRLSFFQCYLFFFSVSYVPFSFLPTFFPLLFLMTCFNFAFYSLYIRIICFIYFTWIIIWQRDRNRPVGTT